MVKGKIICIGLISIFLISSISAVGISINDNDEGKNNDSYLLQASSETINIGTVYIGENYIEFEDIKDKTIWTDNTGVTLIINATVHFRLGGLCDHGYAYLGFWNQPYEDSDHDGESRDSTLSFIINNAKPGDRFEIQFKADYEDCLNEDFSEREKVIITIKEEIKPDLWPIETWISSESDDWAKEHVLKKVKIGETVYSHLRYNILYTEGKNYPMFVNRVIVWVALSITPFVYRPIIPSSVGTGAAKELQMCQKIDGSVFDVAGPHSITIKVDTRVWNWELNELQDIIDEINEDNNEIRIEFQVGYKSKSRSITPLLNLLDNLAAFQNFIKL
jgi:hypothetical protein